MRKNLLIGVTCSVAAIKLNELAGKIFDELDVNVCVIATENARRFMGVDVETSLGMRLDLDERMRLIKEERSQSKFMTGFSDTDEWCSWSKRDDPVLHIELRKWAHMFLIAPLDANTLAKLSNGLCDNLLTCVARAWDIGSIEKRPIVVCPAMNTMMYEHPLTRRQLDTLTNEFGYLMIDSIEKRLMCGDVGKGAMAAVDDIFKFTRDKLNEL